MSHPVALWNRLLAALRSAGVTVDARMTPAELGRKLEAGGDARVLDFVVRYYYPAAFGKQPGTLDEASARALVESLEARPARPPAGPAPRDDCPLCGGDPRSR